MLRWFYRLMPRQGMFFPLFERHAAVIVTASRTLREMLKAIRSSSVSRTSWSSSTKPTT
jgi:hypothetical protein